MNVHIGAFLGTQIDQKSIKKVDAKIGTEDLMNIYAKMLSNICQNQRMIIER